MASINEVLETQKTLEESLMKRMADFEAHLTSSSTASSPATDLKELASEFCQFKDMVGEILKILRLQIAVLMWSVDTIETRHRRKAVLFNGMEENEDEDLRTSIIAIAHNKLGLTKISRLDITSCHRLGAASKVRPRPVLVRFADLSTKAEVWRNKTKLKGSPVSVAEFLTRRRQEVFVAARRHFGFRRVWTSDGNIVVKLPDGKLNRVFDEPGLNKLIDRFPSAVQSDTSAAKETATLEAAAKPAGHKSANVRPKRALRK